MEVSVIKPSWEIKTKTEVIAEFPRSLEEAGRLCYASEVGPDSDAYVRARIAQGHTSLLEHCSISVLFVLSRAAGNQLVRHRHCAFTQESLRYVRPKALEVVSPAIPSLRWMDAMEAAASAYDELCDEGWKRENARTVLPLCTATRIRMTTNLREWRQIFDVRCDRHAQAELRELMTSLRTRFAELLPCVFGDENNSIATSILH